MKDEDFKGIVASLEDAIAFVRGDTSRGRVAAGPDVKAIRAKTRLSQAKFADKHFRFSPPKGVKVVNPK